MKRILKSAMFRHAEFMSAKDMLQRAAAITVVYVILHLAGFREFTGILNGTIGSLSLGWNLSGFLAVIYIVFYLMFVILVPVLVLAAAILIIWQRRTFPRQSTQAEARQVSRK